jgi:hypothetical protein
VREQQKLFNASVVLIEDKASGTQLIQDLIEDGCHGVTRYQPTGDKTMRMHAQTAMIENGFVHLPETAPWLAEYLHELTFSRLASMTIKPIQPHSFSIGIKRPSLAKTSLNCTGCGPSNCDAGRAPGSVCGRHPASAPCKPSRADTSMLTWTAPSKCRPKTPNTISVMAGPNGLGEHYAAFKADRHQRAPMLDSALEGDGFEP